VSDPYPPGVPGPDGGADGALEGPGRGVVRGEGQHLVTGGRPTRCPPPPEPLRHGVWGFRVGKVNMSARARAKGRRQYGRGWLWTADLSWRPFCNNKNARAISTSPQPPPQPNGCLAVMKADGEPVAGPWLRTGSQVTAGLVLPP